jgi:hypothetical protein
MAAVRCSIDTRPSFRAHRLGDGTRVYWLAGRPVAERNVTSFRWDLGRKGAARALSLTHVPENTRVVIAHQYTAREPRHSSAKVTTQASHPSCCIFAWQQLMPAAV